MLDSWSSAFQQINQSTCLKNDIFQVEVGLSFFAQRALSGSFFRFFPWSFLVPYGTDTIIFTLPARPETGILGSTIPLAMTGFHQAQIRPNLPGDETLERVAFIVSRLCIKGLNLF
ncbi:hypothetical protein [Moorena sp. SIO3I8]|uniref:hypothetical protein n=1 Tax=Moorena sp. SIO3I8 TaxID=2607833 RepID=UPI0025CBE162|nr:hypothetical protein [Moorena sp. SIO3I8]